MCVRLAQYLMLLAVRCLQSAVEILLTDAALLNIEHFWRGFVELGARKDAVQRVSS